MVAQSSARAEHEATAAAAQLNYQRTVVPGLCGCPLLHSKSFDRRFSKPYQSNVRPGTLKLKLPPWKPVLRVQKVQFGQVVMQGTLTITCYHVLPYCSGCQGDLIHWVHPAVKPSGCDRQIVRDSHIFGRLF